MKAAISPAQLAAFLDQTRENFGQANKIGAGQFPQPGVGVFPVEFERGNLDLFIALDKEDKVAGLRLSPPAPAAKPNATRHKTALGLPFKGEWFVFWGGDTEAQNYHQAAPNQRFAFDILKVDAQGRTHRGDGKKNEDYYAFGQELLAPADGVVTYVVDGVHDNTPGEMNRMYAAGNLVIIKHAEGEYSLLAHFKQRSIRVKVGDKVMRGQLLGLCGNSGNSSEAHLHYQLQNAPFFANEASIKIFFDKLINTRDGKKEAKSDYSPVKGDIISPN
jgi:murein DD-endopeptidase MepM/ murein hydrolase activator NlpD